MKKGKLRRMWGNSKVIIKHSSSLTKKKMKKEVIRLYDERF